MSVLSFKPNNVANNLISWLKDKKKDIVSKRFGLDGSDGKTLEEIGQKYGITRERVRQIINFALSSIKDNPEMKSVQPAFSEIRNLIEKKGWVVFEKELLEYLSDEPSHKNHILFLLTVGDDFVKLKEDDSFNHRWTIDENIAGEVHKALNDLHGEFDGEKILAEKEIIACLKEKTEKSLNKKITDEIVRSWLNISKIIANNSFGEWGQVSSPVINPRGMRDLAFLVLKKHGSPMHFSEVAEKIGEYFSRPVHLATVHNELIKDSRFVLVGRGLYALSEWGYKPGTVRDIIKSVLENNGPLGREEVVKVVLRERHVKENTVLIGLQNSQYFRKNKDGKYIIV